MWILFIICLWNINTATCVSTFDSRYLCHCVVDQCDPQGSCNGISHKCVNEWFGLGCQYQNLAYSFSPVIKPTEAERLFKENDESKCDTLNAQTSISIEWNTSTPFTWMRIKVNDSTFLTTLSVTFSDEGASSTLCANQTIFQVTSNVFDIACDVDLNMTTLQINGDIVEHLCYVHVNGGRNLAFFQTTSQSSTWNPEYSFASRFAVDGVINDKCSGGQCSHTLTDQGLQTWDVTFDRPYEINKFVLFNRFDEYKDRLKGFYLQAFNSDYNITFSYTNQPPTVQYIYTMVYFGKKPVNKVVIGLNDNFLTINEFQAYGDCLPGWWGLNCTQRCNSTCSDTCNTENGLCRVCIGAVDPPLCTKGCPEGKYGLNCQGQCAVHCEKCNKINGSCLSCQPGWSGPTCEKGCPDGKWGPSCVNNCSLNCYNVTCNGSFGLCLNGCKEGYQTDSCSVPCDRNHYGRNCLMNCSSNCFNHTCNSTNGFCDKCVPGHQGDYCNQTCGSTLFGQDCKSSCNTSCLNQLCEPINGTCFDCQSGRVGDQCDVCPEEKYGLQCLQNCSSTCNYLCNPVNGVCVLECPDGYQGDFCNETCGPNYYGPRCGMECSVNCLDENNKGARTCSNINGSCLYGCKSDFKGSQCFEALASSSSPPIGPIVGGIAGFLAVVALIMAAILCWRQKRHLKSKTPFTENRKMTNLAPDEKNVEENVIKEEVETPIEDDDPGFIPDQTYYNTSSEVLVNMSMPVHELNIYMKSHDKEYFIEQFKKIPLAQDVTTEVALSEENINKNRYKNICPYDHTRVHLLVNTGKKEGDYINASYIRDNKNKVKFIASQGPNKVVLNDFIRMLWEQKVDIVVTLTNLIEEGKVKCEQYWPESGKVSYGDTKVEVSKTKTFADYTIRTIELYQNNSGTRILTQYHFTSWPDQRVPNSPWALVDLVQKVFTHPTTQPIVVHCSAGVGRTGTFIALHNVLKDAEETGKIDFFNTLIKLRQDRIFMIQTPDQYEFLHRAVQAALICTPTVVSVSDCSERVKELLKNEVSGLSKIEKEYRSINLVSKDIRNSQLDGNEVEKSTKEKVYQNAHELKKDLQNRFPNIMPRKFDRPYLVCEQKSMSDYINAVFATALYKKDQHIITQLPMPKTVLDLWRLVKQYEISLMVAFELENLVTDQTIAAYLPTIEDSSFVIGNIEIHCTAINKKDLWEEQILKLRTEKSKSESQDVIHLKCKSSKMDVKKLLCLVLKIRAYNVYRTGRTLFLCRNGATFSGLCSVLSTVLDRLDEEANVSVPLVVGAMKTVRPEVIPNLEQYRIVYEVLERYCTTSSPYTNVGGEKVPLSVPSHLVNNSTFNEVSMEASSVYNNV